MRSIFTRLCLVLLVSSFLFIVAAGVTPAQEIKGPIKIVSPYPAGGGTDVVARLIADKLKDSLARR